MEKLIVVRAKDGSIEVEFTEAFQKRGEISASIIIGDIADHAATLFGCHVFELLMGARLSRNRDRGKKSTWVKGPPLFVVPEDEP